MPNLFWGFCIPLNTGNLLRPTSPTPNSSVSASKQAGAKQYPKEGRNVGIVTLYSIGGLAFFGLLAYYISNYFAK